MKQIVLIASTLTIVAVTAAAFADESPSIQVKADVVYGHKDGLALTMDVFKPVTDANGAAILFIVSGGWYSHWTPVDRTQSRFEPYLAHGYTMIAVRHGSSPRYSIPEAVADVRRSVRFVRRNADRFGIDADRLGVLGMSAGGHLSLMLGTTGDDGASIPGNDLDRGSSRVAAVVSLVPPTDLRVMVWEATESLPAYRRFPALDLPLKEAEENSPLVHVTEDDAPALVIAGAKDDLVPAKHGRWIDKAFEAKGVDHKLIVFPDAGHGLGGQKNQETIVREAIDWFDHHLVARE